MTKSIIIMVLALTASSNCLAAPSSYDADALKRPSPINPTIPMDPKPAETITVITNPKELAKFKREIGNESANAKHSITAPTTVQPTENQQSFEHQILITSNEANQVKHRQKRDEADDVLTKPLIYRDQHKQPLEHKQIGESGLSATPQTLPAPIPPPDHQTNSSVLPVQYEEAQKLPKYFDAGKHSEMKRDIPVPLVPKYHHLEESLPEEEKHDNNLKNTNSKNDHSSTTPTSTINASTANSSLYH